MLMSVPFEHFKELLLTEQHRLLDRMNLISILISNNNENGDNDCLEDQIAESIEAKNKEAILSSLKDKLDDVNHALLKLNKGSYGYCDICGNEIPLKRLEAIPQTSLCLECKKRLNSSNHFRLKINPATLLRKEPGYQQNLLDDEVETDHFMDYEIYGKFE